MTEFQDKIIRVSIKTQVCVILAVVGGVSSFWIGVGQITSKQNMVLQKLDSISHKQELRDVIQDNAITSNYEKWQDVVAKLKEK